MSSSQPPRHFIHAATQKQVATTNQTATAFLGGRTRSWMHNCLSVNAGNASARSTTHSAQKEGAQGRSDSSDAPVRDVQIPQRNHGSGAPQQAQADHPAHGLTPQEETIRNSLSSLHSQGSILPSPVLTNESSPPANTHRASPIGHVDAPNPIAHAGIQHCPSTAHVTESGLSLAHLRSTPRLMAPAMQTEPSAGTQSASDGVTFPEAVAGPLTQPPTRERSHASENNKRSRDVADDSAQPSKRPRMVPGAPSSIRTYVPRIEAQMTTWGDILKTNGMLQYALRGLREACLNPDEFYVLVHQLLHVWLVDPHQVYFALAATPMEPSTIERAFLILSSQYAYAGNLEHSQLEWLATFPEASIALTLDRVGSDQLTLVAEFLSSLATKWDQTVQQLCQKEIPATSYIMTYHFHCRSSLLRNNFYLFTRRMFVPDEFAGDLDEQWQMEDYAEQAAFLGHGNESQLAGLRGLNESRYRKLIQAFKAGHAGIPQQVQASTMPHSPSQQPLPSGHQPHLQWWHQYGPGQQTPAQQPAPVHQSYGQQNLPSWQTQGRLGAQSQGGHQAPHHQQVPRDQSQRFHYIPNGQQQVHQFQNGSDHSQQQQEAQFFHVEYAHWPHPQMAHAPVDHIGPPPSQPQTQRAQQTWLHRGPRGQHASGVSAVYNGQHQPHPIPSRSLDDASSQNLRSPPTTGTPTMTDVPHFPRSASLGESSMLDTSAMGSPGLKPQARQPHVAHARSPTTAQTPASADPNLILPSDAAGAHQQHTMALIRSEHRSSTITPAAQQRTASGSRQAVRVIPPHRYPVSGPGSWESVQMAAHLLQVRSPLRKPMDNSTGRHYQYIEGFAVMPTLVSAAFGIKAFDFDISAAQLAAKPVKATDSSNLPVRLFSRGTYRWRLRCLTQSEQNSDKICRSDWAVRQHCWPAECYVQINNHPIPLGRRQHFKRDLPAELTDWLVEGRNKVKISVPKTKKNILQGVQYYFAVERVVTRQHGELLRSIITGQAIEPEWTKQAIAQRLGAAHDDEEVAFASKDLTISLADPFSSLLLTVPVRGKACKHLECFDLFHWLNTRTGKKTVGRPSTGEPSAVDEWKCPICGADARPPALGVDLFLKDIRDRLVEDGRPTVKSVQVAADGAWTAVDEPDDTDTDDGDEKPFAESKVVNRTEVIEVLDDD